MDAEQLPLVHRDGSGAGAGATSSDSLQQQLSSYHERQRARQKRRHRSKTVGRATVGFLAASLLALLLVALSWPAQRNERALELRALLDAYEHARNFSGVVRLSHNGQKKLQQAMGLANVPFAQPMHEHSVFPMGAHVQLLTAVAMYQLQEKRVVALERPVAEYLTVKDWKEFGLERNQTAWCPKVGAAGDCEQVTFQHLLYMGSGIQSRETTSAQTLETLGSFGRQVGQFIDAPLAFKPGTSYKYADENYVLLAYMVEKLSGLSFGEYLGKHVFKVLGLKLTRFDPYAGAMGARHGLVDQYVQFYAHRKPNVSDSESENTSSSSSSSGPDQIAEKHLDHMATGSCAIYQGLDNSLHGLQSTGKDMHKIYTDLFHERGLHSKLLKPKSIELILNTRNPAFPAFGQGIGVDFDEAPQPAAWPAKIAFCGRTACTTTCMAMQTPAANMSIVASAFSNDVRLYFPTVDAFQAYTPRDFLDKRGTSADKNAFKKNDGEVNTLAWSLLQVFLRYYAAPDN